MVGHQIFIGPVCQYGESKVVSVHCRPSVVEFLHVVAEPTGWKGGEIWPSPYVLYRKK
jgi:hypothetical protein